MITALIVSSVILTTWLLFYGGTELLVTAFWRSYDWAQQHGTLALIMFFIISFVSQLIVIPSGSLMLLLAGFALGALPAAAVFAAAQVLSAWPVYVLSRRAIKPVKEGFLRTTAEHRIQKILDRLATLRGNEVLATVLIRVTPVIPSAGACLLGAICGISIKPFMIGTLLTCWIRPLFFASSGAAISAVLIEADVKEVLGGLDVTPLLLVFFSAVILFFVGRKYGA